VVAERADEFDIADSRYRLAQRLAWAVMFCAVETNGRKLGERSSEEIAAPSRLRLYGESILAGDLEIAAPDFSRQSGRGLSKDRRNEHPTTTQEEVIESEPDGQ
jgi:hypothetical protein